MPPKAILFDFDGVIAETENHHLAAWQRTMSFMGLQIGDEIAARAMEVDDRAFLTDLFTERAIPIDKVDEFFDAIDSDDVERATTLMKAARVEPSDIATVIRKMENADDDQEIPIIEN